MDDLIAFVRAQLDDDERVASVASDGPWRAWQGKPGLGLGALAHGVTLPGQGSGDIAAIAARSWLDAEHIARWDPARVLAEVEAKRRILDEYAMWDAGRDDKDYEQSQTAHDRAEALLSAIKLLALPYAGKPGYLQEWAP